MVGPVASEAWRLFGPGVAAAEVHGSGDAEWAKPEELGSLTTAVSSRRREFAAGRACARTALAQLGRSGAVIPVARDRSPIWPPGYVGSITHTDVYALAVVGTSADWRSLGVDAEGVNRLTRDLWPRIMTVAELEILARLGPADQQFQATVAFSAKEAFFKCQFPLTGAWIDFIDAEVLIDGSQFEVRTNVSSFGLGSRRLTGALARMGERIVTGIGIGV